MAWADSVLSLGTSLDPASTVLHAWEGNSTDNQVIKAVNKGQLVEVGSTYQDLFPSPRPSLQA
jgi:hypothetical protein